MPAGPLLLSMSMRKRKVAQRDICAFIYTAIAYYKVHVDSASVYYKTGMYALQICTMKIYYKINIFILNN